MASIVFILRKSKKEKKKKQFGSEKEKKDGSFDQGAML